jgi:hypothetical protein
VKGGGLGLEKEGPCKTWTWSIRFELFFTFRIKMSVSESDRKRAIDMLMKSVLNESSTSEEKKQIAMRLAQRKEQDVYARSQGMLASYTPLLMKLISDISQIKKQGPSSEPSASATVSVPSLTASHSQDKRVVDASSQAVINEFWAVLDEIKVFSPLVEKLLARQEAKIKVLPAGDQRLANEEKKLLDLKKLAVVMQCNRTDQGIDEKLESHKPEKVAKLKRHLEAMKMMAPSSGIKIQEESQEEEMGKRRRVAFEMTDEVKKALDHSVSLAQASLHPHGVVLKLVEPNPSLATNERRRYFIAECSIEDRPDLTLTVKIRIENKSAPEACFHSSDPRFYDPQTSILRSLLQSQQPKDLAGLISTWKSLTAS